MISNPLHTNNLNIEVQTAMNLYNSWKCIQISANLCNLLDELSVFGTKQIYFGIPVHLIFLRVLIKFLIFLLYSLFIKVPQFDLLLQINLNNTIYTVK